ncbi:MAG: hypothetical protein MZV65_35205 [Chromatiales bacterium]|nr:hypothetical protein [Chromatiales bacterium]
MLHKPVRQAELYKTLCRLLSPGGRAGQPALGLARAPAQSRFVGRILVAEDNPVNQEMALAVLDDAGLPGRSGGQRPGGGRSRGPDRV